MDITQAKSTVRNTNHNLLTRTFRMTMISTSTEPNSPEMDRLVRNVARIASHPWAAIEDQLIYTLDSTNLREPIRKMPNEPWLREVTEIWMREPLTVWPKSRRMKMSWLMSWNHLWLGMFHEGARVYVQSETEIKSNELIQRMEFMYKHFPLNDYPLPKLRHNRALWCLMDFPLLYSQILGVAQGANQLRQYTATAVLADEIAFWEKGAESIGAFKPTIEGGGKVTLISSFQAGFFRDLCFDVQK